MFFVIGIVMILVQGGYVRRIKPGKEVKVATMVGRKQAQITLNECVSE